MSAISTYITKIRNAIYGREVRGAIADAITECYSNVTDASIREDAFYAAIVAATENNIINNNALATQRISALSDDPLGLLGNILTPGIYTYTNTEIAVFSDLPIAFKASAGLLLVIQVTNLQWCVQILVNNTQMFSRTISPTATVSRPWTEIGESIRPTTETNTLPRITDGNFQYLPAGTYQINANTVVAANALPTVTNSSGANVTLKPGTLVSESPLKGEIADGDYTDTNAELVNALEAGGSYDYLLHYYGVESTSGRAYHFVKNVHLDVVDDSNVTIRVSSQWIDMAIRARELYPQDTVYHKSVNITDSSTRLSDLDFLTTYWTYFRLKGTPYTSPSLDLPDGYTLTSDSTDTFILVSYPSQSLPVNSSEIPSPPGGYEVISAVKGVQRLEIINASGPHIWYRTVINYLIGRPVVIPGGYSTGQYTDQERLIVASNWIEH